MRREGEGHRRLGTKVRSRTVGTGRAGRCQSGMRPPTEVYSPHTHPPPGRTPCLIAVVHPWRGGAERPKRAWKNKHNYKKLWSGVTWNGQPAEETEKEQKSRRKTRPAAAEGMVARWQMLGEDRRASDGGRTC